MEMEAVMVARNTKNYLRVVETIEKINTDGRGDITYALEGGPADLTIDEARTLTVKAPTIGRFQHLTHKLMELEDTADKLERALRLEVNPQPATTQQPRLPSPDELLGMGPLGLLEALRAAHPNVTMIEVKPGTTNAEIMETLGLIPPAPPPAQAPQPDRPARPDPLANKSFEQLMNLLRGYHGLSPE